MGSFPSSWTCEDCNAAIAITWVPYLIAPESKKCEEKCEGTKFICIQGKKKGNIETFLNPTIEEDGRVYDKYLGLERMNQNVWEPYEKPPTETHTVEPEIPKLVYEWPHKGGTLKAYENKVMWEPKPECGHVHWCTRCGHGKCVCATGLCRCGALIQNGEPDYYTREEVERQRIDMHREEKMFRKELLEGLEKQFGKKYGKFIESLKKKFL